MAIKITICDDSSFARKQMLRALPSDWDVEVTFAEHGEQALTAIQGSKAEVLFLDLNMPVMDGYQTLEVIHKQDLPTLTIVVSGDIQPEAHRRVTSMGAIAFIKKPIDSEELIKILRDYGIHGSDKNQLGTTKAPEPQVKVDALDPVKEIANVAMGRAADLLARLLGVFVIMPIPRVSMLEISELRMALNQVEDTDQLAAVCQGFIGAGIAGEALLVFNESNFNDIAELMKHEDAIDESVELELLMDMSNILLGACLKGIADQLDIGFSQSHPMVLGRHVQVHDLIRRNANRWQKTLAIEIGCQIENRTISCDVLLLFTEDSIAPLQQRLSYIVN